MGCCHSTAALWNAEHALLSWGVQWYTSQQQQHANDGIASQSLVHFERNDVQLSQGNPNLVGHIHYARYLIDSTFDSAGVTAYDATPLPLVCLHGFGSGIGQFATSLPAIRAGWPGDVFALDSFGCGLSSRPSWTLGFGNTDDFLDKVEEYFVAPLEAWRTAMGIDRMVLLGHSMGGYLAVCYTLQYPNRVERLILVSPAGIPKKPPDASDRLAKARGRFRVFLWFWNRGWSPFTAVKLIGRRAMKWYTNRRYKKALWIPIKLLTEYLYQNWTSGRNSGGGCLQNTLLEPGAWARRPLSTRMPGLRIAKVSFVYGIRDWMDSSAATAFARDAPHIAVEMVRVADGGHNMMIDNPSGFADAVLSTGDSPEFGQIFGSKFLLLESRRLFEVGQEIKCKRGSRRDWTWELATLIADNGDGTFVIRWHADNTQICEGGYLFRYVDEDVSKEQNVEF